MKYRQWHKGPWVLGLGFDRQEWSQVKVSFDMCVAHRYATIEIALLGGMLDLMVMEREAPTAEGS